MTPGIPGQKDKRRSETTYGTRFAEHFSECSNATLIPIAALACPMSKSCSDKLTQRSRIAPIDDDLEEQPKARLCAEIEPVEADPLHSEPEDEQQRGNIVSDFTWPPTKNDRRICLKWRRLLE
jgi:hypothetical protein